MTSDTARLLMDVTAGPTEGGWNMAVDEALLQTANQSGSASVRFYAWHPATLSLGYFQRWADRVVHPDSFSCPVVRRSTGGGAILHDRELTYSLCLPSQNRWCQSHEELYWKIHRSIIQWLGQKGIKGYLHQAESQSPLHQLAGQEPFLCFQRRTAGDVILKGHKIMGSAQRRQRNALLQHGSLLLVQSEFAPQLPGILEIAPDIDDKLTTDFNLTEIANELVQLFEEALEMTMVPGLLTDAEQALVRKIRLEQASEDWLKKR